MRNTSVASRIIDGVAILVSPRTNNSHVLNETGSFFWTMVNGENSIADIAATIANQTSATLDELTSDLKSFTDELQKMELLESNTTPIAPLPFAHKHVILSCYAPPEVLESYSVEVLAALCDSALTGNIKPPNPNKPPPQPGKCRTDDVTCKKLFE